VTYPGPGDLRVGGLDQPDLHIPPDPNRVRLGRERQCDQLRSPSRSGHGTYTSYNANVGNLRTVTLLLAAGTYYSGGSLQRRRADGANGRTGGDGMRRWLGLVLLVLLCCRWPSGADGAVIEWTHDGANVTYFTCVVDGGTRATWACPRRAGRPTRRPFKLHGRHADRGALGSHPSLQRRGLYERGDDDGGKAMRRWLQFSHPAFARSGRGWHVLGESDGRRRGLTAEHHTLERTARVRFRRRCPVWPRRHGVAARRNIQRGHHFKQ